MPSNHERTLRSNSQAGQAFGLCRPHPICRHGCLALVGRFRLAPLLGLGHGGIWCSHRFFFGGIHWGIGFKNVSRMHNAPLFNFGWGVVPSLMAWVAVTMPAYAGLPLLALILGICYAVDRKTYLEAGLQEWMPMRWHLTLVAALSCLIGAAAT